jgi:flagellar FliL protein
MSKDKTDETESAEKGGGKKKLILMLAVVLLAGAGAAYFFLFAGSGEAAAEAEPVSSGTFVPLDAVAVNLAGGGYLKIGVSLELTEEGAAAAGGGHGGGGLDGSKAIDLIISTFSQADPADVSGAREALKESLEQKIIEAYTTEEGVQSVMGIYYTEYVTQ